MDEPAFMQESDHIVPSGMLSSAELPDETLPTTRQFAGYVFADGNAAFALQGVTLRELQTFVPPDFWRRLIRVWQGMNALKANHPPIADDSRFGLPSTSMQTALMLVEREGWQLFVWIKNRLHPDNMSAQILESQKYRGNWQIPFGMLSDGVKSHLPADSGPTITMADLLELLEHPEVRLWLVENYMQTLYSA